MNDAGTLNYHGLSRSRQELFSHQHSTQKLKKQNDSISNSLLNCETEALPPSDVRLQRGEVTGFTRLPGF